MKLEDVQEYLNGKDIAIVGNSSALFDKRYGKDIDAHECVLRMGLFLGKYSDRVECLGSKVDAWASNVSVQWRGRYFKKLSGLKCILILFPYHKPFRAPDNVYQGSRHDYWELKRKLNGDKPSTGCMVINFLDKHIKYKNLSIYGMDFFQHLPWTWETGYPGVPFTTRHNGGVERGFIIDLISKKDNVIWCQ